MIWMFFCTFADKLLINTYLEANGTEKLQALYRYIGIALC